MKSPTYYRLLIVAASLLAASQLFARPVGLANYHCSSECMSRKPSIRKEVAERKTFARIDPTPGRILKSQGASDSLIQSLRSSNLVVSKEEAVAVESAAARESSASQRK